jgi:nicotinamide-nucleotide amidase
MRSDAQSLTDRAEHLIDWARERKLTFATVETCAAGALTDLLANTTGASEVYRGGVVAGTKESMTIVLGVPPELIADHSAVSPEVATAMAQGVLRFLAADIAVSVTGVLGPEPDADGTPVGLVYFGLAKRDGFVQVHEGWFDNQSKEAICDAVLETALLLLDEGLVRPMSAPGAHESKAA